MYVEVIAIGDELLIGQVTDTNSGWTARQLNCMGWELTRVTVVRDRADEIKAAVTAAFSRVSVVLMTGGLGPTKDDITKKTLCDLFGCGLHYDERVQAMNEERFSHKGFAMNSLTRDQALVPDDCTVLYNPVGTAPVMWFDRGDKVLVSMPGVPSEMQYALTHEVLPRLRERFNEKSSVHHATCLVKGYTESALAIALTDFENELPAFVRLAYLPKPGVIRLRLTATGNDDAIVTGELDRQFRKLTEGLGSHVFCREDATLAEALGMILREEGLTLATAESCTGGNIAHEITLVPGCSAYYRGSVVSYANDVKSALLDVSPDTIAQYGVVSLPVVEEMARGVCRRLHTDCSIATSGIAGPDGATPGKPVGTVAIAVAWGEKVVSKMRSGGPQREHNIDSFTHAALLQLIDLLRP
ncbi:MAG: CinA family nicotinamide mononucleotide deamidase-related protein [Porphyromonadaceae bacterium]|nr:CinA family nicotinamide mononucleotide deamidase-related protein [Porphyromonadaceae bacterium]